jgi:hypothetical protein
MKKLQLKPGGSEATETRGFNHVGKAMRSKIMRIAL